MIRNILVLGAGSAGLIAAISLKRKIPALTVRIVRSPEIGVIGVGEGTTPNFPQHLFEYLGLSRKTVYAMAQPTWKLGIRFLWGPRGRFDYGFGGHALDARRPDLPQPNGFYCDEEFRGCDLPTSLMGQDKVFARNPRGGGPDVQGWHAFHIENKKLVETLEAAAHAGGVEIIDGTVKGVERGPTGVSGVILEDSRRLEADFFVDASGFRSELLGRALEEPFVSFERSLFCDRAVVGGWERTTEPILPYTTAETMDAGWAWQIEHEHHVNRGYVFSSAFLSDEDARAEFLRKNPKAPSDARIVRFRSGRYRRVWVDNVVAIGNAAGFVEPLEATALMVVCAQSRDLVEFLRQTRLEPTPTMRQLHNDTARATWEEIRDFLGVHYRFNTRLDTPFWRHCQRETDLSGIADFLAFYEENGPSGFARHRLPGGVNNFGLEGWLVMMVGNRVPYSHRYVPTKEEQRAWKDGQAKLAAQARDAMSVKEALGFIRHQGWTWHADGQS